MLFLKIVFTISAAAAITTASNPAAPRITEHPIDTAVARLSPVTLNCRAVGDPAPVIHWVKDGRRLAGQTPHRVQLPRGSLFLLTAGRRDAGVYWCRATNRRGAANSRNATLAVAVLRDEFRETPVDTVALQGERVVLRCSPPKGDPPPSIHWRRNQTEVDLSNSGRLRIEGEGSLVIDDVRVADEGIYICEARNYARMRRLSAPATLTVNAAPQVSVTSERFTALIGQPAELWCHVTAGRPAPSVRWLGDGGVSWSGHRLTLGHMTVADAGVYVCQARNSVATATANVTIIVQAMPQFDVTPPVTTGRVGESRRLPCSASGHPEPFMFWSRGDEVLVAGHRNRSLQVFQNNTLFIRPVSVDSEGEYACHAISEVGVSVSRGYLRVLPSMRSGRQPLLQSVPLGGATRLTCHIGGADVAWHHNGRRMRYSTGRVRYHVDQSITITDVAATDRGWYHCSARSPLGRGQVTSTGYLLTVTGSVSNGSQLLLPLNLTQVTALNSTAVRLHWQLSYDISDLQWLKVWKRDCSSGQFSSLQVDVSLQKFVMSTLMPYSRYDMFLTMRLRRGDIVSSRSLSVRTLPGVPLGAPADVRTLPYNNTTVLLKWMPPASGLLRGPLIGYRIYINSALSRGTGDPSEMASGLPSDPVVSVAADIRQFSMRGLEPGVDYRVQMSAVSAAGEGPRSRLLSVSVPLAAGGATSGLSRLQQMARKALVPVAASLAFLVLILTSTVIFYWRNKNANKSSSASYQQNGKPCGGVTSAVRPASWMYGSAWGLSPTSGAASSPATGTGSSRKKRLHHHHHHHQQQEMLPSFSMSRSQQLHLPATETSPYATTELINNVHWEGMQTDSSTMTPGYQVISLNFRSRHGQAPVSSADLPRAVTISSGSVGTISAVSDRQKIVPATLDAQLYEQLDDLPGRATQNDYGTLSRLKSVSCSNQKRRPGFPPKRSISYAHSLRTGKLNRCRAARSMDSDAIFKIDDSPTYNYTDEYEPHASEMVANHGLGNQRW